MSEQDQTKIAVYGGAFDPPHNGHIYAIATLLMRTDIREVWLLPTARHVFGKQMTAFKLRCEWLVQCVDALGWSDRVSICDIESKLGGDSRTFCTLEHLESAYPDERFVFVIGADNLAVSKSWYRFDDLVRRWPLIVFGRPGYESVLRAHAQLSWCSPETCLPAISSTAIRAGLGRSDNAVLSQIPFPIRSKVRQHFQLLDVNNGAKLRFFILGMGRVGSSLAATLSQVGHRVYGWSRGEASLSTWLGQHELQTDDIFVLTVPDSVIGALADELNERLVQPHFVFHCAGGLGPVTMTSIPADRVGVIHPIRSIATPDVTLSNIHWGVSGGKSARKLAVDLLSQLGGTVVSVRADGHNLYHAAMVMVGNFPAALMTVAEHISTQVCDDPIAMRQGFITLMQSAINNLAESSTRAALTGPIARRDLQTVMAHLSALSAMEPKLAEWYRLNSEQLARLTDWIAGCEYLSVNSED
ncbi:MAG: nicotinate (nicotinamide) nucleotide adenylyltransferase [Bradymonadia bacterium]